MLFKKCQVVMLPTNKKAQLYLDEYGIFSRNRVTGKTLKHHLYILSDDEIKEGDWYLHHPNMISISQYGKDEFTGDAERKASKKIIANTDKLSNDTKETGKHIFQFLPQPSPSFIEKYVAEYNKGNIIIDVMVEYEETQVYKQTKNEGFGSYFAKEDSEFNLKINPKDNTITIKKVKDSWSREEVNLLIKNFCIDNKISIKSNTVDKWISENL